MLRRAARTNAASRRMMMARWEKGPVIARKTPLRTPEQSSEETTPSRRRRQLHIHQCVAYSALSTRGY